jgi:hypothetical protein
MVLDMKCLGTLVHARNIGLVGKYMVIFAALAKELQNSGWNKTYDRRKQQVDQAVLRYVAVLNTFPRIVVDSEYCMGSLSVVEGSAAQDTALFVAQGMEIR